MDSSEIFRAHRSIHTDRPPLPSRALFPWIRLLVLSLVLASAHPLTSTASSLIPHQPPDRSTPAAFSGDPLDLSTFFTEEEMAAWKQYRLRKMWIHLIGLGSTLLFYLVLILTGLNGRVKSLAGRVSTWCYAQATLLHIGERCPSSARMVKIPERMFGGRGWLEVLVYCIFFLFLMRLFFLPQEFYRSYWFDRQYGLSNYSLSLWLLDYVKALCLGTFLLSLMVFGIYGLIARIGKWWWVLLWAGVSAAIAGYVMIAPYGAHIYSEFHPLESGELRDRLEALMDREGLQLEDILVVDASRRTKKVNAYLTGSGPSRRIVLYDTLLEKFTPREITMILAHELGHWKEPDARRSYMLFSLTVFCVLALAASALKWGTRVRRFHYTSPTDVAGLPVLFLTFFLAFQVLRPVNLHWKRARELATDMQSLERVCDPEAFITTHVKLARINHSDVDPHPLFVMLFASHPPFLQRVETALAHDCRSTNSD